MLKKNLKLVSQHIWSRDKTAIQNVPKEIRVVGVKNVHTLQQLSAEQGETLMILTFINAMQDQGYLEAEGTLDSVPFTQFRMLWVVNLMKYNKQLDFLHDFVPAWNQTKT